MAVEHDWLVSRRHIPKGTTWEYNCSSIREMIDVMISVASGGLDSYIGVFDEMNAGDSWAMWRERFSDFMDDWSTVAGEPWDPIPPGCTFESQIGKLNAFFLLIYGA